MSRDPKCLPKKSHRRKQEAAGHILCWKRAVHVDVEHRMRIRPCSQLPWLHVVRRGCANSKLDQLWPWAYISHYLSLVVITSSFCVCVWGARQPSLAIVVMRV